MCLKEFHSTVNAREYFWVLVCHILENKINLLEIMKGKQKNKLKKLVKTLSSSETTATCAGALQEVTCKDK